MTFGAGSVSFRRIKVLEESKRVDFAWIWERLGKNLVEPIGIEETREESSGWCHPYTGEPNLEGARDLVYNDVFVFGMRTDVKKIPSTLFRLQMKAILDALQNDSKRAGDDVRPNKIPKKVRDAARDRVRQELLKRMLPNIRLVEVGWDLQSGEIWIGSNSKAVFDSFDKLFSETFALPYVQLNPGTMAIEFSRVERDADYSLEKLFNLQPVDLFGLGVGGETAMAANVGTEVQPF
jgi:hypothetical protein